MKRQIALTAIAMTLPLTLLSWSCASLRLDLPPRLENRTLHLVRNEPVLEYQYLTCVNQVLGLCFRSIITRDLYDLRDEDVRKKLIDTGFVFRVREKP